MFGLATRVRGLGSRRSSSRFEHAVILHEPRSPLPERALRASLLLLSAISLSGCANTGGASYWGFFPGFDGKGIPVGGCYKRHTELLRFLQELLREQESPVREGDRFYFHAVESGEASIFASFGQLPGTPGACYLLNVSNLDYQKSSAVITLLSTRVSAQGQRTQGMTVYVCHWDGSDWYCSYSFGPFDPARICDPDDESKEPHPVGGPAATMPASSGKP